MNDIISGRKAAYEGLLLEAILQEATAREVYDKFFSGKVSQDAFFSLLSMDPTSVKGDSLESSVKGKYSDWLVSRQGWTKLQNRYSCSITLKKRGAIR